MTQPEAAPASMLSRPFVVLYASAFLAAMGISMVSPLLPVYAEELGATGVWIGLTFSIFALTQMLTSPFVGGWSDRHGRKPFIITGLVIYFVAALGFLFATELWQVLAFRALSGAGTSMIFSVARAYLGGLVPPGHEGRWSGVFTTSDIVGFGIGPVIAGFVRSVFGFDSVFVGMATLMAAGVVLVGVFLPARPPRGTGGAEDEPPQSSIRVALRDRQVVALVLVMGLMSLSFGAALSFIGIRLERVGVNAGLIGLMFTIQSFSSAASQPLVGRIADRVERRLVNSVGLIGLVATNLLLGTTEAVWAVGILMGGLGVSGGTAAVATQAMMVDAGRVHGMGRVIGLGSAGNAAGVLMGSVLGGAIVDLTGRDEAAFFTAATAIGTGLIAFRWLTRGRHRKLADSLPDGGLSVPSPSNLSRGGS